MKGKCEIVLYQPDEITKLEVRIEEESVWLTLNQMSLLFGRDKSVISRHISAIYREGELDKISTVAKNATVQNEKGRSVVRQIEYYNLDVIISVGYRVKSLRGTRFRQWASKVLKDYLLKGHAINQRMTDLEQRVNGLENKVAFFVHTSLPPVEGVFFDGQVFDAFVFVNDLIRSAKKRIILIDNYVDDSILLRLAERKSGVSASILTKQIAPSFIDALNRYNQQYDQIDVKLFARSHDRFLIVDEIVYHIGASIKDLGKRMFAFCKMEINAVEFLKKLE